jgi:hypothetical protein
VFLIGTRDLDLFCGQNRGVSSLLLLLFLPPPLNTRRISPVPVRHVPEMPATKRQNCVLHGIRAPAVLRRYVSSAGNHAGFPHFPWGLARSGRSALGLGRAGPPRRCSRTTGSLEIKWSQGP